MLLWLSVLLCSGACWAGELLGAGGGWYFNSPPDNTNDITAIEASFGDAGLMKSIRLRFGSSWGPKYGVEGGRTQTFVLQPGEHVTSVYGSGKAFIRYLVFYTDQGRWFSFGKEEGNTFTAQGDLSGKVLTGVFGQHRLLGITGIGFQWDYPLVQPKADNNDNNNDNDNNNNDNNNDNDNNNNDNNNNDNNNDNNGGTQG